MTDDTEYLNVQAAAEALGTNRRRIWQLVKEGQLETVTRSSDLTGQHTVGQSSYSYSPDGLVTGIVHQGAAGNVLARSPTVKL